MATCWRIQCIDCWIICCRSVIRCTINWICSALFAAPETKPSYKTFGFFSLYYTSAFILTVAPFSFAFFLENFRSHDIYHLCLPCNTHPIVSKYPQLPQHSHCTFPNNFYPWMFTQHLSLIHAGRDTFILPVLLSTLLPGKMPMTLRFPAKNLWKAAS